MILVLSHARVISQFQEPKDNAQVANAGLSSLACVTSNFVNTTLNAIHFSSDYPRKKR